jgi:hypothetical protein
MVRRATSRDLQMTIVLTVETARRLRLQRFEHWLNNAGTADHVTLDSVGSHRALWEAWKMRKAWLGVVSLSVAGWLASVRVATARTASWPTWWILA